ncbi:zinc ribbon domain-containing protein [Paractinoplanes rishiriensis]|uniref:zinc ribbon domain-containing protein n=1 Tax=Paractinoplanes rishiriensis TaxID=1050105 RepID=UPI0034DB694D
MSCGHCGHRVGTRYQGRDQVAYYDCMGHRDAARSQRCRSVAASTIDTVVAQLLLSTLTAERLLAHQITTIHTKIISGSGHGGDAAINTAPKPATTSADSEPESGAGVLKPHNTQTSLVRRPLSSPSDQPVRRCSVEALIWPARGW